MADEGSGNFRAAILVIVLYVLLLGTGCAWLQEIDPETKQPRWMVFSTRAVEVVAPLLPPPWNWVVGGVLVPLLAGTGEAARRKLKNSPEGKLFGPLKRPQAPAA